MTKYILATLALGLMACGSQFNSTPAAVTLVDEGKDAIACSSVAPMVSESRIWDLYVASDLTFGVHGIPTREEFQNALASDSDLNDDLKQVMDDLFELLVVRIPFEQRLTGYETIRAYWASLEIGDSTTQAKIMYQKELKEIFLRLNDAGRNFQSPNIRTASDCRAADEPIDKSTDATWYQPFSSKGFTRVEAGSRWAFTTSYQICSPIRQPALTTAVPNLVGISEVGVHPDGVGLKRIVTDLPGLLKSHYYMNKASSAAPGCFNTYKNPLIYDYGGKPYTGNAILNFFKDSGDGTSALGIDCSGYVFSAMATAGLKLSANKTLKASTSHGISSHQYVNPSANGLDCLDKVTFTPTSNLRSGDIVAVPGHVFFIHTVGADPWGIKNIKTAADCDKVTHEKFDFTVMQSNPTKKGMGINISQAKDYLPESDKVRKGLVKYAIAICKSKVAGTNIKPSYTEVAITRHKGTAQCIATRIPLESEKCISSCAELYKR